MRPIDDDAIDRAVRHTALPRSQVVEAVRHYLDGLEARALANNPRICQLADMKVGDSLVWASSTNGPHRRYLQTQDKRRARVLMDDQNADWLSKPVGFGVKVTRTK